MKRLGKKKSAILPQYKVDEANMEPQQKFVAELVVINKALKERNYMDAYKMIDQLRARIISSRSYTSKDASFVKNKLNEILISQYAGTITNMYESKIEQYRRMSEEEIQILLDLYKYPRETGQTRKDYLEAFYRSRAIADINLATKDFRYGAYMPKIIDMILNPKKYGDNQKRDSGEQQPSRQVLNANGKITVMPIDTYGIDR